MGITIVSAPGARAMDDHPNDQSLRRRTSKSPSRLNWEAKVLPESVADAASTDKDSSESTDQDDDEIMPPKEVPHETHCRKPPKARTRRTPRCRTSGRGFPELKYNRANPAPADRRE